MTFAPLTLNSRFLVHRQDVTQNSHMLLHSWGVTYYVINVTDNISASEFINKHFHKPAVAIVAISSTKWHPSGCEGAVRCHKTQKWFCSVAHWNGEKGLSCIKRTEYFGTCYLFQMFSYIR